MTPTSRIHGRASAALCIAVQLWGCTDPATEGAGGGEEATELVCPTCQTRAGGETADFGERTGDGPGMGSSICDMQEAELTAAVEDAFELDALRGFLEQHEQEGHLHDAGASSQAGTPVDVKLSFELDDFTYHRGVGLGGRSCDSVWAKARAEVKVGDGLLAATVDGDLWKVEGSLWAHFHGKADLANARGSYQPEVDTSRLHAGEISLTLFVYPNQLRGTVTTSVVYFASEGQVAEYLDGEIWAPARETLFSVQFGLDECAEIELPLAASEETDVLHGRSPRELQREAIARIGQLGPFEAVWRDDEETELSLEPGGADADTVCAESGIHLESTLVLHMPTAGRLRTDDGRIDMPLDELSLELDADALRRASLRGLLEAADLSTAEREARAWDGDHLDAWVTYDLAHEPATAEGIVYVRQQAGPSTFEGTDCVAFPPGGEWDTGECRYMR